MMTKLLPIPLALALLAMPSPASAADAASDAAAEALFLEAKALDKVGDTRGALAKFLEAQRVSGSVGTLLNIGDCYERLGQLASAWGAFKSAENTARAAGDPREAEAARRAAALLPRLSKLTIGVPAVGRAPGFGVRRDGEIVGEGQWGTAVPVDPGEHVIEATAPGRQKWTTRVQVAAGGASVVVSVPDLLPEKVQGKPEAGSAWGAQRIAGVAIGGAGAVGLIVGSVLGAQAIAKKNASNDGHCDAAGYCDPIGKSLRAEGMHVANAATATFIASGVAAATGVALLLTAPSTSKPKGTGMALSVGPGRLDVTARW